MGATLLTPPAASLTTESKHPGTLDFELPHDLEASAPPEARGIARDHVRLLVSDIERDRFTHTRFVRIGDFLDAGDLLVINTSGTMNAALDAARADGTALELHLSTRLPDNEWAVELRLRKPDGAEQFRDGAPGEVLGLPSDGTATLIAPYSRVLTKAGVRLWRARLDPPVPLDEYLARTAARSATPTCRASGRLGYQNVFAPAPASAEMPSAGRGFSESLITQLVARGIAVRTALAPHRRLQPRRRRTAVSRVLCRPRADRPSRQQRPLRRQPRRRRRHDGRPRTRDRDRRKRRHSRGRRLTDLVVAPPPRRTVDGLLTGFHEPRASHLAMLEAIAGRRHLEFAYAEALRARYLWHEFGDAHLMLRSGMMETA